MLIRYYTKIVKNIRTYFKTTLNLYFNILYKNSIKYNLKFNKLKVRRIDEVIYQEYIYNILNKY